MSDFEAIVAAYEASGGDSRLLQSPKVASLVVSGNMVLGLNEIEGLDMVAQELSDGVRATVRVASGTKIELPVHLCFGVLPAEGIQRILVDFHIEAGAYVEFIAHCTFPNAAQVQHIMQGSVHVGENASMRYRETHFHGDAGGVEVLPKVHVQVDEGGRYFSDFVLSRGRAGKVDLDYTVDVGADGITELDAKVMGYADDEIIIRETINLNGERARGLAKSRIALSDRARAEVHSTTEGNAAFCRGHVDCVEIIRDEAVAQAIPIVVVRDYRAQVTHEAAIGTVDKKELETLMSRGLDEDAAVDVIVRGMLGDII